MWFNKKKEEVKDPFADKVKCEECKHWVDKGECQEVIVKIKPYFGSWVSDNGIRHKYYCPMHKKPYDIIQKWDYEKEEDLIIPKYFKTIPEHEEEVDKNGKKIAPKKQKTA